MCALCRREQNGLRKKNVDGQGRFRSCVVSICHSPRLHLLPFWDTTAGYLQIMYLVCNFSQFGIGSGLGMMPCGASGVNGVGGRERIDRLEVDEWEKKCPRKRGHLDEKALKCAKCPYRCGQISGIVRLRADGTENRDQGSGIRKTDHPAGRNARFPSNSELCLVRLPLKMEPFQVTNTPKTQLFLGTFPAQNATSQATIWPPNDTF